MLQKKIFIVEKDCDLLSILKIILKDKYAVYSFLHVDDAFYQLLHKIKPDLVILEWLSPLMNSDECINAVKDKYGESSKILIISNNIKVKKLISKKNVDGFLMKPFRMHEFQEIIDNLFLSAFKEKS